MSSEVVLKRTADLSAREERRMFALFARHFRGVTAADFRADRADKGWVLLLEAGEGSLAGFSTFRLDPAEHEGERLTVLYSGDTIVDPSAWGTSALPRTWIDAVWRVHAAEGRGRLVWLLITSGYRTYRFLPVFWRRFYPRADEPTPEPEKRLLDKLARERFGEAYDAERGVARLRRPQPLAPHLAGIPKERLRDPHVAFFARQNPGHARGDELVSIAELSAENLTPAGARMARAGRARPARLPGDLAERPEARP